MARMQSDYAAARSLYEESLALWREFGNKLGIANALHNLGVAACSQSDYAATLFEQSLTIRREVGDKLGLAESLEAFAALACVQEQPGYASQLWGAAEALREAIDAPLSPYERSEYDKLVAQARSAMDEAAFALAWAQGRAMTMEQAIAYTLGHTVP